MEYTGLHNSNAPFLGDTFQHIVNRKRLLFVLVKKSISTKNRMHLRPISTRITTDPEGVGIRMSIARVAVSVCFTNLYRDVVAKYLWR